MSDNYVKKNVGCKRSVDFDAHVRNVERCNELVDKSRWGVLRRSCDDSSLVGTRVERSFEGIVRQHCVREN